MDELPEHDCEHETWDQLHRRCGIWRCRRCGEMVVLPTGQQPSVGHPPLSRQAAAFGLPYWPPALA
jgi:hypothetical protein